MSSADQSHTIYEVEQVLQPIPEEARTHSVSGQFWIWCGANIAPINWVLGALGVSLGLGLRDTLIVLVLGNLIGMALFGLFVLMGQRTGVTGMVLSRSAFGRRGAYLPAAIQACLAVGWCAVNTWIILDLVMALLGKVGVVDPGGANYPWKIGVAALIMGIQVAISWAGYRTIAAFERWTVPPTILVLVAMSVVAWFHLDINWGYAGPAGHILTGSDRWVVMSGVMTAIGIGWGITWFTYAGDYSRFVSRTCRGASSTPPALSASSSRSSGSASSAPRSPPRTARWTPAPSSSTTSARWPSPSCCSWSTARSRPTSSTSTRSRWPPRRWTSRSTGAPSASSSASSRWPPWCSSSSRPTSAASSTPG